jgi:hypothetical protein
MAVAKLAAAIDPERKPPVRRGIRGNVVVLGARGGSVRGAESNLRPATISGLADQSICKVIRDRESAMYQLSLL